MWNIAPLVLSTILKDFFTSFIIESNILRNHWLRNYFVARQLAKSEKRKNTENTFVQELDNPATEHFEASSDYFALAPVNQLVDPGLG
jgi:hypothetical protein